MRKKYASRRCGNASNHHTRRERLKSTMASSTLSATLSLLTFTSLHAQETCPSSTNGWAASFDCKSYFWCSAGSRSSITYSCIENTEFDVSSSQCLPSGSFVCQRTESPIPAPVDQSSSIDWSSNGVSLHQQLSETIVVDGSVDNPVTATPIIESFTVPTNYPTKLGPPLYYGDFRTSSCRSAAADPNDIELGAGLTTPGWITEEYMYRSKEECCVEVFNWVPLESCLGEGWVETNFVRGSRSPTLSPSFAPTGAPSEMPSLSTIPSSMPSVIASDAPSSVPSFTVTTLVPTITPTTVAPTISEVEGETEDGMQVMTSSGVETDDEGKLLSRPVVMSNSNSEPTNSFDPTSFLVELLGWANTDNQAAYSGTLTNKPTKKPTADNFSISEIIIPIIEDATISQQRQTLNFGANSALAVDGGFTSDGVSQSADATGEKFDSILKFDIGIIDNSRPIDKAALRIFSLEDCSSGGTFTTTTDSSWHQSSVSWESAPLADGYEIGSLGRLQSDNWYELDVISALTWNDAMRQFSSDKTILSIRISSTTNGRCMYSSMEREQTKAPYLSVRYGQVDSIISEFSTTIAEPPTTGQFLLLRSTDDSTIDASNPNAVSGSDSTLRVAFDPSSRTILDSIIRFDLSEIAGASPVSAVLSLYAEQDCSSAGSIMTTEGDSSWNESEITWSSAPSYQDKDFGGGFMIGAFGEVSSHSWYGFDVVQAVQQAVSEDKKAITFRISAVSEGVCVYSSRESGRDAKLMVAF